MRARIAAEQADQKLFLAQGRLQEAQNILDRVMLGAGAFVGGAAGLLRMPGGAVSSVVNGVHDGLQELARQEREVDQRRQDVIFAETDLQGRKADLAFQEEQVHRAIADLRSAGC